jgi:hypothetical protein
MAEQRSLIDDAIDRAVRDIMRRDPPAGLRGRVLSRVDLPGRRVVTWPRAAVAATAVAAAAIAVVTLRPLPPAPRSEPPRAADHRPGPQQPLSSVTTPPPRSADVPVAHRPPPAPREPVRTATFAPPDGRVAAASVDTAAVPAPAEPRGRIVEDAGGPPSPPPIVIDALTPPAPIEIAPIVVAPMQLPRIHPSPVPPPR